MAVPCPEFARNLAAGWKTSTEQLCPTSCLQLCSGELDGDVGSYSDDDDDDFCDDDDADNEVVDDNLGDVGGGGGGGGGGDLHHQACGGVQGGGGQCPPYPLHHSLCLCLCLCLCPCLLHHSLQLQKSQMNKTINYLHSGQP